MNKHFSINSLYVTLIISIIFIVTLVISLYTAHTYITTKERLVENIKHNSKQTMDSLKKNIAKLIESYSINEYNLLLQNELEKREIFAIIVEDYKMSEIMAQQVYVSGKIKDSHNKTITDFNPNNISEIEQLKNCFYFQNSMLYDDKKKLIGKITIYISDTHLNNELKDIILTSLIYLGILTFVLIFGLIFTIRLFVLKPISSIVEAFSESDEFGLPKRSIPHNGPDEIILLANTMNDMIAKAKLAIEKENDLKSEIFNEKNKLKVIIKNIPDLLWIKDLNGVYIACNKRFEDFFGASEEKIVGKTDYDFVDKELADFFRVNDQNAMNSDTPVSNFEEIAFANDNHKEYLHTIKLKIVNLNNEVIGVLGIGRDITEIRDQEVEILKQKEEFETIFHTSNDGIAIVDLESNFLEFNEAYLNMTGFTREELLSKSCIEITVPEDKERNKEVLEVVIKDGYFKNFEKSCIVKDDKILSINMSLTLMPDKKRILLVTKDMTTLKILESQAKLASMGEMIGNIAHQWRQPLNVISTMASSVIFKKEYGSLKDEELIPDMENIIAQTQYLSTTIDDFRNFIKGKGSEEILNITRLFEKTLSIAKPSLKNNYIDVITHIEQDITIKGYENELMQALINIINNAKDALVANTNLEEKYIFVEVKNLKSKCEISIKDNGGGIMLSIINRIFEPYFTTKHQSQGTGLGLAMTYKIITEMHRGSITVENATFEYEGKEYTGANFSIVLSQVE